jgi:hypothetical protein
VIQRQSLTYADGMADLVQAGLACRRGNTDGAAHRLRQAIDRLTAVELRLHAGAARRQLGRLVGGEEGDKLVQESDAWMAAQGIRNPERVTQGIAPGFPEP